MLLVKLAPPIASTPRTAARRVTPRRDASTAAIVNQSTPWLAEVVIPFSVPAGEGGSRPIRQVSMRSA